MTASLLRQAADSLTARAAEMRAAFPDSSEPGFLEAVADQLAREASAWEQVAADHPDLAETVESQIAKSGWTAVARAWLEVSA